MQELEFKSCWPFCDDLFLNSCSFNLSSHKEMYAASIHTCQHTWIRHPHLSLVTSGPKSLRRDHPCSRAVSLSM